MFDLLDNIGRSDHLQIIDDHKGGVQVKGLTMVEVSDEQEVLNHFFNGENNRAVNTDRVGHAHAQMAGCIVAWYGMYSSRF